ncbi:MAG: hypothetical protein SFW09_01505 [Hyphomicrobiaceae bacterium]|nr:hypothetical protein [Hyphomicrobiaceae bacterium]
MNAPANDAVVCDHSPARTGASLLLLTMAAGAIGFLNGLPPAGTALLVATSAMAATGLTALVGSRRLAASPALVLDGCGLSWHGPLGTHRVAWSEIGGVERQRSSDGTDELILHTAPGSTCNALRLAPEDLASTSSELLIAIRIHAPDIQVIDSASEDRDRTVEPQRLIPRQRAGRVSRDAVLQP